MCRSEAVRPESVRIGGRLYTVRTDIRDDPPVRASFNALAGETFGIDFEPWRRAGFWDETYCPHVLLDGDEVVACLSANPMRMRVCDRTERWVQIGTVMTKPSHRNRGLGRYLMERVLRLWDGQCERIMLFANDSVLDYYPKFGFVPGEETGFVLSTSGSARLPDVPRRLDLSDPDDFALLAGYAAKGNPYAALECLSGTGIRMFDCMESYRDGLWLIGKRIAVIEEEGEVFTLLDVMGEEGPPLRDIAAALAGGRRVRLGFTPTDEAGCTRVPYREEDCTLFLRGRTDSPWLFPLLART